MSRRQQCSIPGILMRPIKVVDCMGRGISKVLKCFNVSNVSVVHRDLMDMGLLNAMWGKSRPSWLMSQGRSCLNEPFLGT